MPNYFNPGDSPAYLEDGRVIGGGEWVDLSESEAKALVETGDLVSLDEAKKVAESEAKKDKSASRSKKSTDSSTSNESEKS